METYDRLGLLVWFQLELFCRLGLPLWGFQWVMLVGFHDLWILGTHTWACLDKVFEQKILVFKHWKLRSKKKKKNNFGKGFFFFWSICGLEILVSLRGNFILSKLLSLCANNSLPHVYYFLNKIIESKLDIMSALHLRHKWTNIDGRTKNKTFCKV